MVHGSLFFAGAKSLEEILPAVDVTSHAAAIIGLRGKTEVGSTFVTVLRRYAEALRSRDSKLMLAGVDLAVGDQLAKTGALKLIGEENVFLATRQIGGALIQALAAANAWLGQPAARPADGK